METVAEWRVVQPVPCRNASELNASNPLQSPSCQAAGSQWKSKLSQAESGLVGQVTLARLRQRATSDQNKDRRRDCADSPLGPGQGLGQGLWRTRSISRRWSRLKATQSGDPV